MSMNGTTDQKNPMNGLVCGLAHNAVCVQLFCLNKPPTFYALCVALAEQMPLTYPPSCFPTAFSSAAIFRDRGPASLLEASQVTGHAPHLSADRWCVRRDSRPGFSPGCLAKPWTNQSISSPCCSHLRSPTHLSCLASIFFFTHTMGEYFFLADIPEHVRPPPCTISTYFDAFGGWGSWWSIQEMRELLNNYSPISTLGCEEGGGRFQPGNTEPTVIKVHF